MRGAMLISTVALALCIGTATANADEYNRRTILTIDQPMMVPGATLAPGTYTFTLTNPETSRDVVTIMGDDGTVVASAHVKRMKRNSDKRDLALEVALGESGAMPAMKGWFYPGDRDGYQFVYPKDQRRLIAQAETVEIPVVQRG